MVIATLHTLCTAASGRTAIVFNLNFDCFYSHFQVFLQVTTYGILPRLLRFRYKWRQLHELQLPDRRSWSVYPSFSFQILLLTILLNTAATQVLGKGKRKDLEGESLSCRKYRNKILDGLMVQ